MADYQLTASEEPCAVIFTDQDGTVWHIPPDPANRHYADYLVWCSEGGVPDPYVPPPVVPPAPTNEQQILYDHENRVRALEGHPPLSLGDFLAKLSP